MALLGPDAGFAPPSYRGRPASRAVSHVKIPLTTLIGLLLAEPPTPIRSRAPGAAISRGNPMVPPQTNVGGALAGNAGLSQLLNPGGYGIAARLKRRTQPPQQRINIGSAPNRIF